MKLLKLMMYLTICILFFNSTIEAAKSNFDRSKPHMKADCKKLKGDAKKECVVSAKDNASTRATDYNSSRSNRTVRAPTGDGDAIVRKKPGRTKLAGDCDDDSDGDGLKEQCKKNKAKKPN